MKNQRKAPPYSLRMTEDLKQWASDRAGKNGRSLNAEINRILKVEQQKEAEEQKAA